MRADILRHWLPGLVLVGMLLLAGCSGGEDATPVAAAPDADSPPDVTATMKRAEQGEAEAQNTVGQAFATGVGLPRDEKKAYNWFHRAAKQGHTQAQYNLGLMLERGRGVKAAPAVAAQWYVKAADQGLAQAQFQLGNLYRKGHGVAEDFRHAAALYQRAAEQDFGARRMVPRNIT